MKSYLENNISAGMDISFPDELFIGRGLAFYVKGWVYHPRYKIKQVEIKINDACFQMDEINQPRMDIFDTLHKRGVIPTNKKHALYSGFSGCFDLNSSLTGTMADINIIARFKNGSSCIIESIKIYFKKKEDYYFPIKIGNNHNSEKSLIAICMATYNPDIEAFKKQILSITKQSYKNWICIISDDSSDEKKITPIQKTIEDDERFFLIKNQKNLGYYYNFERALCAVPAEAKYVALSDQDDFWYPNKLEKLIERLSSDQQINLVYSDMRIVRKNGALISKTYWRMRKNHYKDIGMVMVCGTVTGAASLFRKKLLETALPFTQNTGNAFHDHLISCAALATGKIDYIDTPLYDYIQHDINVIGHHEFKTDNLSGLVMNDVQSFARFRQRIQSLYENYDINYIRLHLIARSLLLRTNKSVYGLRTFNNKLVTIIQLFLLHLKIKIEKRTTENAEIVVALSIIARKIYKFFPNWLLRQEKNNE